MRKKIFISAVFMISAACQSNLLGLKQTLSAGDLTREYRQSKAGVRSKYDGKEITVRGYVITQAAMPDEDDYEGLITLEESDGEATSKILCWFSRREAAEFSKIKGDQYVTVKGVFNGELGTELKFCKLVKTGR